MVMKNCHCSSSCGPSLQKFSDDTTMHGFHELYYGKSFLWKMIWFLLISAALGLTGYQVFQAIQQANDQQTSTVIETLTTTPEYPPIKICYLHWMYWLNWTLASEFGFTRNSVLFGMSYMTTIVSDETFDVNQTKADFYEMMKKNNLYRLLDFYRTVSNPTPPGFDDEQLNKWEKLVDPEFGRFCYVVGTDIIQNALQINTKKGMGYSNMIGLHYLTNFYSKPTEIHNAELEQYLRGMLLDILGIQLSPNTNETVLHRYKVAPTLIVDRMRYNFILPSKENYMSRIKLSGSLFQWLNTDRHSCDENATTSQIQYDYCDLICHWKEYQSLHPDKCSNLGEAVLLEEDFPSNVCNNDFVFLAADGIATVAAGNAYEITFDTQSTFFNTCMANSCQIPCQEWKFESTVTNLPLPEEFKSMSYATMLYVEYPPAANIMVISQVYTQTWETIIGNIGGIIGLWMGASIMSLVQMVYICCFSQCDDKLSRVVKKPVDRSSIPHIRYHGPPSPVQLYNLEL